MMDNNPSGFAGTAKPPKNPTPPPQETKVSQNDPPPYMRGPNGAIYSAKRQILPAMPNVRPPKNRDVKTFAKKIYSKLLADEERERDGMAIANGQEGYDKPLPKSVRSRLMKQAESLAVRHMPKEKARRRKVKTGGGRKTDQKRLWYRATGINPDGTVTTEAFPGGRGRASANGFKFASAEEAEEDYRQRVVPTLTDAEVVVGAIDKGYKGPIHEDLDDEQLEAAAEGKTGFFARLTWLRKWFG